MDKSGNLYGTTETVANLVSTVFELTPNAAGTKWTCTVRYTFCSDAADVKAGFCIDGASPKAGVLWTGRGTSTARPTMTAR
jgi:hypothetical protein